MYNLDRKYSADYGRELLSQFSVEYMLSEHTYDTSFCSRF